jgi:hypothetical protein
MKANKVKLNIPEPCHEDWNKMTLKEQGSFCGSCAKTVVDFTKMSDREVIDYLAKTKDQKTCGRFTTFQIGRELLASTPQPSYYHRVKNLMIGAVFSLGLPGMLKAEKGATFSNPSELRDQREGFLPSVLKGTVVNEQGQAIPFAQVSILQNNEHTGVGARTDIEGKFLIKTEEGTVWKDIRIESSALGYFSDTKVLDRTDNLHFELALQQEIIHSMGDVYVEEVDHSILPKQLSGTVRDEYGETIPFVNVLIVGSEIGAISDIDGNFEINLDEGLSSQLKLRIEAHALGYETQELIISPEIAGEKIEIVIRSRHQLLLGMIMIEPIPKINSSGFDENYQEIEPKWKREGFDSRREYQDWGKEN